MPTIAEMHSQRHACLAECDKIASKAQADGRRDLTADEQQRFDRLHTTAAELHQALASAAGRVVDTAEAAYEPAGQRVGTYRGHGVYVAHGSAAARRAQAGYVAAWRAGMFGGMPKAVGTDVSDGGFHLAPPQFVAGLLKGLDDGGWFRRLATVRPPTTAPRVTQATRTAQTAAVVWAEHIPAEDPDADPKFGGYSLYPHWLSGEFLVAAGVVSAPGGEDAVRGELVAAAAAAEERAFVSGDGAGKPLGLFHPGAPGQGIGTDRDLAGDVTSVDTWIDARLSLRSVYLRSPSLRWVMHPGAYKVAAKIKDTAGRPLVTRAQRAGDPDHIDGVAIELTDDAPTGSGPNGAYVAGDYLAVVGDLRFYDIQDGLDFGINRHQDERCARRGLFSFIFRRKVDGTPRVAEAFTRLKVGT